MKHPLAKVYLILLFGMGFYCKKDANVPRISDAPLSAAEDFLNSSRPRAETFKISAVKSNEVKTKRGTAIRIPKSTFDGSGKVTIKVTETLTPAEGAALKVPMRDDQGRTFQSDGMFRLDTAAKLIGKSRIRFSTIAQSDRPMNVYSWRGGKWIFEGKNQLVRSKAEEGDSIRSFTGVEPNVLYNYDLPIDPKDESCVILKLPTEQTQMLLLLFENYGRSTTSAHASNSDNVGISFIRGTSVRLVLWGPNKQYWEKDDYRMPQKSGALSDPQTCETLTVAFRELTAMAELSLKDIKAKYGRIARIETKSGEIYKGYFYQSGADMSIVTTRGVVVISVADVQKVTPMN